MVKELIGNDFLLDSWNVQGYGRGMFDKAVSELETHTELVPVNTKDFSVGYVSALDKDAAFTGTLFTAGLSNMIKLKINKSEILQGGIKASFLKDIEKNHDVLIVGGYPYFTGSRTMLDLSSLAKLGGDSFNYPCPERSAMISAWLPKLKEVKLIVRKHSRLRKAVAVRAKDFSPYTADTLMDILDTIEDVMDIPTELEYSVNHAMYNAYMLMDDYAKYEREMYGLKELIPFISVQDSAIGESAFTIRTGIEAGGNKIVFSESSWNHNMANDTAVEKIVLSARQDLASKVTAFIEDIAGTSVELPDTNTSTMESLLRYVYDKGAFNTQLGKEMWNEAKRTVMLKFSGHKHVTGSDIMKELFCETETTSLRNQRAMSTIPKSIGEWLSEKTMGQLTLSL